MLEYMHLNPFDSKGLTIIVINFWKQWKIVQLLENSKDVYWTLVNLNFSDYKYTTNRIVKYITISIQTVEIAVFATEWAKKYKNINFHTKQLFSWNGIGEDQMKAWSMTCIGLKEN